MAARRPEGFDLQGHRGARGLLPENTIPAFLRAVELGVDTVELDTVVTRDRKIVASHDPWFDHRISTRPDGRPVRRWQQRRFVIFRMAYDEVAAFDCGLRRHPAFPGQQCIAARKPLLTEAIRAVEARVRELGRPPAFYNIETKSRPEWDGRYQAEPGEFVRLLCADLAELGVLDRTTIQSFDVRTLQVLREIDPEVRTSLLVKPSRRAEIRDTFGRAMRPITPARLEAELDSLGFTPEIYSPDFRMVDEPLVRAAHDRGMLVIPWTVNIAAEMERLIEIGADGLITDYPDLGGAVVGRLSDPDE